MRISFDLDGTAWKYRRFFIELAVALKAKGHKVGILTAHSDDLRAADLALWQARGFPSPDFFYNAPDWREERHLEGLDLRGAKLAFAERVGIDCHIDDFDDRHPGELELALIGAPDQTFE